MKPLYDIKSAARLLAISPWSVRLYIRQRKLCAVRIGRRVLLEESELERFVAEAKDNGEFVEDQKKEKEEQCQTK